MKLFAPSKTGSDPVAPMVTYADSLRAQVQKLNDRKMKSETVASVSALTTLMAAQAGIQSIMAGSQPSGPIGQALNNLFSQNPGIAYGVFAAGVAAGSVLVASTSQIRQTAKAEKAAVAKLRNHISVPAAS